MAGEAVTVNIDSVNLVNSTEVRRENCRFYRQIYWGQWEKNN